MILKVIRVLKVFRGKGKAAACTDTLVQNPHGTSTWRHKHIKKIQFPKINEITCLDTTVSYNNKKKKITFKPPRLEASFLTKNSFEISKPSIQQLISGTPTEVTRRMASPHYHLTGKALKISL